MEILIRYLEDLPTEDLHTDLVVVEDTITFSIGWSSYEEHDTKEFVITPTIVTVTEEAYSVMTGTFKTIAEYPFTSELDVIILINSIISDYME